MKIFNYFCVLTAASPIMNDPLLDDNNTDSLDDFLEQLEQKYYKIYIEPMDLAIDPASDDLYNTLCAERWEHWDFRIKMENLKWLRSDLLRYDLFNDKNTDVADKSKMEMLLLNELNDRESNYSIINDFTGDHLFLPTFVEMMQSLHGPIERTREQAIEKLWDYIWSDNIFVDEPDITSFTAILQNKFAPTRKCDNRNSKVNLLSRYILDKIVRDIAYRRRKREEISFRERKRRDESEEDSSWKIFLCKLVMDNDFVN